jgi:hypothetical protein
MAGYGQTPPRQPGGAGGAGSGGDGSRHDAGSASLMQGLRQSDEAIDPHDPDFSPLGSNVIVPPYLVGDPQYDPGASPYNLGGYSDPYGDDGQSGGPYDAHYSTQPGFQSGYSDDGSYHGAAGNAAAAAAQDQPPITARNYSPFSIEAAAPLPQQQRTPLGPDGRPKGVRRGSIEVSRVLSFDAQLQVQPQDARPAVVRTLTATCSRCQL